MEFSDAIDNQLVNCGDGVESLAVEINLVGGHLKLYIVHRRQAV